MFKITYNKNGAPETVEFERYMDLVLFVAENKIMDNDFISLDLDDVHFDTIFDFADYVANGIRSAKEAAEAELEDESDEDSEDEE